MLAIAMERFNSLKEFKLSNERCWEVIHSDRVSVDGVVEALRSLFEKTCH